MATLINGNNPTGTVTFRNPVSAATATSDWFVPGASGTYFWTAAYSGDASTEAATSPCQAPNEQVTIAPFTPPAFTRTITGDSRSRRP